MPNWEKNVCMTHMQGNTSWCGWICVLRAEVLVVIQYNVLVVTSGRTRSVVV